MAISKKAQALIATVWIIALAVVAIDAHQYVVSRPWWPALIVYSIGTGLAATAVIVGLDWYVRHRRNGRHS
jgi:hypothetical protein